jgi:hypothetical protein
MLIWNDTAPQSELSFFRGVSGMTYYVKGQKPEFDSQLQSGRIHLFSYLSILALPLLLYSPTVL